MIKANLSPTKANKSQQIMQDILSIAGIEINGKNPWDIKVHDDRFYERVLKNPSLGAGESYMDGWWDCEQLDEFFFRFFKAQIQNTLKDWRFVIRYLKNYLINLQSLTRSLEVAKVHYNLDNQLYAYMLGPTMAYTCAYWKDAANLDEAQEKKYDLVCRKLAIQSQDNILELGCGWGGFARFAAKNYGCKITSVNISEQQVNFAREICAGLPITIYQTDYRNRTIYNPANIQFDKVVSIGMCEHVGSRNYRDLMQIAHDQLKNNGLFLLHTIGNNKTIGALDPWIDKYIFPNGEVPSIKQLSSAMEDFFVMEDWHNFGADYDKTLMAWHKNFQDNWSSLSSKYDQRFYRMWVYYLLSCAGVFRARDAQLWQIVLSKGRGQPGYQRLCD
jgi:cyclopropane-fatty-acyl-phospholipid synthase